ncbi:MAG TPA: DUF4013 domain-containing protein [Chloroflexi bacterium]|nr:DUF4013 domain-containing protein [Chloroflexota bacterium]
MDLGKAFSYVFEDEEWIVKILLGALLMLIPIVGQFALMGYGIAIIRNVRAGEPRPLPNWSAFGEYLLDGLKLWAVTLVYTLPLFVIICPITFVWILPALGGESEDLVVALAGLSGILSIGLICLVTLYSILLAIVAPVLQIRYAKSGEIGDCLQIGAVFRDAFANLGSIIMVALVWWAASIILVPIATTVTLGLLALPASVWLRTLSSHLYGQISRQIG